MSITNPDRVVTKQDLADFYDAILPYLGGNNPVMGEISKSDIYDTTEKVVGKWTDGRPIYQNTINIGTMPNTTNKTANHSISNIDKIVDTNLVGIGSASPYWTMKLPNNGTEITVSRTQYYINTNKDLSSYTGYLTLKYTKTTDAANSYNYADENDYSTAEKIVGTWIDGKPIYQKTISYTMPTVETAGTSVVGTYKSIGATISTIVDIRGIVDANGTTDVMNGTQQSASTTTYIRVIANNNSASSNKNTVCVVSSRTNYNGLTAYITIKYTKA